MRDLGWISLAYTGTRLVAAKGAPRDELVTKNLIARGSSVELKTEIIILLPMTL